MDFTFGIITNGKYINRINEIINSIEMQNIPNYEIIVVGGGEIKRNNVIHIKFDETIPMWITRKKNIITSIAKYDNIVYMHDYIVICDGWYRGFLQYGDNFNVCMNKIINNDGTRYRDWTLWADDVKQLGVPNREYLLPYNITSLSKYMYFSGAYWVVKKNVMQEFPLDERRLWGQGEDVVWSKLIRQKYDFSINSLSSVKLLKQKDVIFRIINDKTLNHILTFH